MWEQWAIFNISLYTWLPYSTAAEILSSDNRTFICLCDGQVYPSCSQASAHLYSEQDEAYIRPHSDLYVSGSIRP